MSNFTKGSRRYLHNDDLHPIGFDDPEADLANEDTFGIGIVGDDWVPNDSQRDFERLRAFHRSSANSISDAPWPQLEKNMGPARRLKQLIGVKEATAPSIHSYDTYKANVDTTSVGGAPRSADSALSVTALKSRKDREETEASPQEEELVIANVGVSSITAKLSAMMHTSPPTTSWKPEDLFSVDLVGKNAYSLSVAPREELYDLSPVQDALKRMVDLSSDALPVPSLGDSISSGYIMHTSDEKRGVSSVPAYKLETRNVLPYSLELSPRFSQQSESSRAVIGQQPMGFEATYEEDYIQSSLGATAAKSVPYASVLPPKEEGRYAYTKHALLALNRDRFVQDDLEATASSSARQWHTLDAECLRSKEAGDLLDEPLVGPSKGCDSAMWIPSMTPSNPSVVAGGSVNRVPPSTIESRHHAAATKKHTKPWVDKKMDNAKWIPRSVQPINQMEPPLLHHEGLTATSRVAVFPERTTAIPTHCTLFFDTPPFPPHSTHKNAHSVAVAETKPYLKATATATKGSRGMASPPATILRVSPYFVPPFTKMHKIVWMRTSPPKTVDKEGNGEWRWFQMDSSKLASHEGLMTSRELDTIVRIHLSHMAENFKLVRAFPWKRIKNKKKSLDADALSRDSKRLTTASASQKSTSTDAFFDVAVMKVDSMFSRMHQFMLKPGIQKGALPPTHTDGPSGASDEAIADHKDTAFLQSAAARDTLEIKADANAQKQSAMALLNGNVNKFGKLTYCTVRQPRNMIDTNDLVFQKPTLDIDMLEEIIEDRVDPKTVGLLLRNIIEDAYDLISIINALQDEIETFPFGHGATLDAMNKKYKQAIVELYELLTFRLVSEETGILRLPKGTAHVIKDWTLYGPTLNGKLLNADSHEAKYQNKATWWIISGLLSLNKGQTVIAKGLFVFPSMYQGVCLQAILGLRDSLYSLLSKVKGLASPSTDTVLAELEHIADYADNSISEELPSHPPEIFSQSELLCKLYSDNTESRLYIFILLVIGKIMRNKEGKSQFLAAIQHLIHAHSERSIQELLEHQSGVYLLAICLKKLLNLLRNRIYDAEVMTSFLSLVAPALVKYIVTADLAAKGSIAISIPKCEGTHVLLQSLFASATEVLIFKEFLIKKIAEILGESGALHFLIQLKTHFGFTFIDTNRLL